MGIYSSRLGKHGMEIGWHINTVVKRSAIQEKIGVHQPECDALFWKHGASQWRGSRSCIPLECSVILGAFFFCWGPE